MKMNSRLSQSLLFGTLMLLSASIWLGGASNLNAQEEAKKPMKLELAGGKLVLETPADWKYVKPKMNMIQYEFSAPADAKKDEPSARITVMAAGGSIDANIDRWRGQFEDLDKEKAKTEKFDAAGQTVHWVDLQGTYKDTMGGPMFAQRPATLRKDYRMLGAIVETKEMGTHFFKMLGPQDEVEKLAEGFKKMLKEMTKPE